MLLTVRKPRTMFLTVVILGVVVFIALHIMLVQLPPDEQQVQLKNDKEIKYQRQFYRSKKAIGFDGEFQYHFVAKGERTPKTFRQVKDNEQYQFKKDIYNHSSDITSNQYYIVRPSDQDKQIRQIKTKDRLHSYVKKLLTDFKYSRSRDEVLTLIKHKNKKYPVETVKETDNKAYADQDGERKFSNLVEDGIYWSSYVESLVPKGMSYSNITRLITSLRKQVVKVLEHPTWDRCGRPKNGYIVLGDDTKLCARYRQPHTTFIFGEALSFYLSRLLGMDNVPAVILAKTNTTSSQWKSVNINNVGWEENKTVALIQWINNINGQGSKSYIPPLFLQAYRLGVPFTMQDVEKFNLQHDDPAYLAEHLQWGTMIIFDYLTGNYDRVASMQDAAEKEQNLGIIEEPIRNLQKSSRDNKLWLIDNESGLLDAYHLLQSSKRSSSRFTNFHRDMLQTSCVFQNSVVKALLKLITHPSPHIRLLNFASSHEPLIKELLTDKYYKSFEKMFPKRLNDVRDWIQKCKTKVKR